MRKYLKFVVGAVFAALILLASAGPAVAGVEFTGSAFRFLGPTRGI